MTQYESDSSEELASKLRQRDAELGIINSVSNALAQQLDFGGIVNAVGDKILEIFQTDIVVIWLHDSESNTLREGYSYERGDRTLDLNPLPIIHHRAMLLNERKPLMWGNLDDQEAWNEAHGRAMTVTMGADPESVLFVPIVAGERAIGIISVQQIDQQNYFDEGDVRLLSTLAANMGVALENARLFDETKQRNAKLAILDSVGDALTHQLDFQAIINVVGEKVLEIFQTDIVMISLYDAEAKTIQHRYAVECGVYDPVGEPHPADVARTYIVTTRQPLGFPSLEASQIWYKAHGSQYHLISGEDPQSWLGVPIILGDRAIGVLSIQQLVEQNYFDDGDVRLLSTLAANMGVALENARLFDETKRLLDETTHRNAELAIINTVQAGLASQLNMQAIFDLVGDKIAEIFQADTTYIARYNPQTDLISFPYYVEHGQRHLIDAYKIGPGTTSSVIRAGKPILFATHQEELLGAPTAIWTVSPDSDEDRNETYVGVPLLVGDRIIGVVSVQSHRQYAYDAEDVRLLTTLGNSMAVALENARLFDETKRLLDETNQRNAELAIINSVGDALAHQLDFQGIINVVGDKVHEIFQTDIVMISLYDPDGNTIYHRYTIERGVREFEDFSRPIEPHRAHIIASRQPLYFASLNEERAWYKARGVEIQIMGGELPESWLGVPMIVGERAIGVVSVQQIDEKNYFDEGDIRLLSTLTSNMGVALENARLFDETKRLLDETNQRNAELAIINSVGDALARQLDFQRIIDVVGDKILEIFQTDVVTISLYNPEQQTMDHRYVIDSGERIDFEAPRPIEPYRANIIATRQPMVFGSVGESELWHNARNTEVPWLWGEPVESSLGVPIIAGERAIGVVTVQQNAERHYFDEGDVRLLSTLATSMGVALETARLFDETKRLLDETNQRNAELAIINSVGDALARQLDFQGIINVVGDKVHEIFQTDIVMISLYAADTNTINHRYAMEAGERFYEDQPRPVETHRAHIITSRQALLLATFEEIDTWFKEHDSDYKVVAGELPQSWLGVPIILGDRAIGVVSVQQIAEQHYFDDGDVRLLSTLASSMGVALENARLFEETKRLLDESRQQATELETVNHVSQAINAELEIDALIQLVGEQMRLTFHADIAYVSLYNPDTGIIEFPYLFGENLDPIKFGEGLTSQILKTGAPLLINRDVEGQSRQLQIERVGIPALSYLGVPVFVERQAMGVLSVQSRSEEGRFGEKDVRLLSTIAANVGSALANARLFAETQKARAAAEAADQSKSDFLSSVSHELRTPLTSVLGFARIIQKQLDTRIFPQVQSEEKSVKRAISGIQEDLTIILAEGERLTTLINNVLDLAKIEAGKIEWHMEAVDMNKVIERAAAATTALFEQKSLTMISEFDPSIALVNADLDRMIQVMINLVSNAVKFTETGSVACRARQDGDQVVVSVIDTGIGIAPDDLPLVFERFKQVGDTLTGKPTGTGLGLPICKEIIEAHRGQLWAESERGVGSTFSFSLPILVRDTKAAPPTAMQLEALIEQLKTRIIEAHLRPVSGALKLLVVDDDDNIRTLLRKTLSEEGYDVREAANGTDAILLVQTEQPALVILDVLMPGISGFDVVAALKNQPETRTVPIVILSIVEDQERGYRLGVDRYLTKPIDTPALLTEISSLLQANTAHDMVLIADSNADTVRQLRDVLSEQAYVVREAFDTAALLNQALADKPGMIIASVQLANQTVISKLRHAGVTANILLYQ